MNPPQGVMHPPAPGSQTALQQALAEALRDRYVLEREIAQGGMAMVYLGREVGREERVAVKVMHPEVATIIGAERFRREIEIVRGMSHPGIVPLTDFGTAAGLLFYVMPYIDGKSVYERVQREGRFPVHDAVRITHEIAEALGHAHARGVLHRDVKPENILLAGYSQQGAAAGTNWHAVVADFGLARAIGQPNISGSPRPASSWAQASYMSPEQAREDRNLDQRADIYSLGCILNEN